MAGYDGFSKSNNALHAEGQGLLPISRISAKTKIPSALIREFVSPKEKHHTSAHYNLTDYYSVNEVEVIFGKRGPSLEEIEQGIEANPDAITTLRASHKLTGQVHENCYARWLEWSGSRANARASEHSAKNVTVTRRGAKIIMETGDGPVVKMAGTNGLLVMSASGAILSGK
jgi:hypothetical protein